MKKYKEAIASFDKALEISPLYGTAWYNKACCYALKGNINFALKCLNEAIKLNYEYRDQALKDSDFNKNHDHK